MKIVTPQEMSRIENLAYEAGHSSIIFMEKAGKGIADIVQDRFIDDFDQKSILLLCGKGNNAGDAFVAGIHLLQLGYMVSALLLYPLEECSELCQFQLNRFIQVEGKLIFHHEIGNKLTEALNSCQLVIDGIFGTGFKGKVEESIAHFIHETNESKKPIISIDIPSGLNGETGEVLSKSIIATETLTLGLPKQGFYIGEGWNHVGKIHLVDFGLPELSINQAQAKWQLDSSVEIRELIPPIKRNRHKYEAGYVVGLAGSKEMPGAALLSSLSALRGGAGIVRLLHHPDTAAALSNSPYELIKTPIQTSSQALAHFDKAGAIFIGPGLGREESVHQLLKEVLPNLSKPTVIDADALYIISQDQTIDIPHQTIFTPHHGEMAKLLNIPTPKIISSEFLDQVQEYVNQRKITLILKGGPTFIFHPHEMISVNPTGDPGMATAGSGDVLTGLLAALLAQGLTTLHAAKIAVFLHGLAGEIAASERTSRSMIASDLINHFSTAWEYLDLS